MPSDKTRFHLTGREYLKTKFIPTKEEEIEKKREERNAPGSTFAERIKKSAREAVAKSGGNVNIDDVLNIGKSTRGRFGDDGYWSPSDFYDAYKEKRIGELAMLAKGVKGKFKTIAGLISLAPEAPADMDVDAVETKISDTYEEIKKSKKKVETFSDRRKREIKNYLAKLKIDGTTPIVVKFIEKGERMTHEKAEELLGPSGGTGPAPSIALSKNKIIRGGTAIMRAAKESIFDRAMRDAMTGIGTGNIATLTDFKNWKKTLQEKYPQLQDKNRWTSVQKSFIKGVIDGYFKDGVLVIDTDTGKTRPSDEEMAQYILSEKGSPQYIGTTSNFQITGLSKLVPASKLDEVESGTLVFQSYGRGKVPIRLTGYMILEKKSDIDKLVEALGTNPKNGFAPVGFEHVDDDADLIMNPFSILPIYPPRLSMETPLVKNVEKRGDEYRVEIKDRNIVLNADAHLWLKKDGYPEEIVTTIKSNVLNGIARENFKKDWADLTVAEKESLAIDDEKFPETWGIEHEYAGSLCNPNKNVTSIQRLRGAISDLETAKLPSGIASTKVSEAIDLLKNEMVTILQGIDAGAGTLNTRAKPNCLIVPKMTASDGIRVKTGSGSEFVEKKLDRIISKCSALDGEGRGKCFEDNLVVTQNFVSTIHGAVYEAIRNSKTDAEKESDMMAANSLSTIEKSLRTGIKIENELTSAERRAVLNEAKLGGKEPLNTNEWKFVDKLFKEG